MENTAQIIAISLGTLTALFFGIWALWLDGYRCLFPIVIGLAIILFIDEKYDEHKAKSEIVLKKRENKILSFIQEKDPYFEVSRIIKIDFLKCHESKSIKEFCDVRYYFTHQRSIFSGELIVPMSEWKE